MKHSDIQDVDERLEQLKGELDCIHAPGWIEPVCAREIEVSELNQRRKTVSVRQNWVRLGIAASFVLAVVGIFSWLPEDSTNIPRSPEPSLPGHLIARTLTPVTVHSISRGAELHYLESRIVHDENGLTRAVYVYVSN